MDTFSISFILGKASDPHGADLAHNDRQFIAPNVDLQRTYQNVTYVKEDIEDAYETLFGEALAEYNARQKQKCRRIENYYDHIRDGDREEASTRSSSSSETARLPPVGASAVRWPNMSYREKLRDDVDRILMQSQDLEELLQRMAKIGYEIKRGKYLAVRPKRGENFIRLRSLGEHYSEFALKNRLRAKARAEHDLVTKITAETDQDTPRAVVLRTMRFYTVTFAKGALPMRRKVAEKPFSWTNDAELDKLLRLNRLVNEGATLDSLRRDLVAAEQRYAGYKASLEELSEELRFDLRLKDAIGVVFEGKCSTESSPEQAAAMLRRYPQIRRDNYRNVDTMIASTQARYQTVETALQEAEQARKEAADLMTAMERVMGGTYVQTLVAEEQQRRVSELLPNGTTMV